MTPFAKLQIKDAMRATGESKKFILSLLSDTHYFDVTEATEIALDLVGSLAHDAEVLGQQRHLLFLPAPKTWIETSAWKNSKGACQIGFHLAQEKSGDLITVTGAEKQSSGAVTHFMRLGQIDPASSKLMVSEQDLFFHDRLRSVHNTRFLLACLLLINTPKVIGRRQHMPSWALERKLTRGLGVGKFPLHAWTEIKLDISKPTEIDDGLPHEAHLTGRRALHFCRAHLRVRSGQLQFVKAHWRGDPAIGIKQSRYKIVA